MYNHSNCSKRKCPPSWLMLFAFPMLSQALFLSLIPFVFSFTLFRRHLVCFYRDLPIFMSNTWIYSKEKINHQIYFCLHKESLKSAKHREWTEHLWNVLLAVRCLNEERVYVESTPVLILNVLKTRKRICRNMQSFTGLPKQKCTQTIVVEDLPKNRVK